MKWILGDRSQIKLSVSFFSVSCLLVKFESDRVRNKVGGERWSLASADHQIINGASSLTPSLNPHADSSLQLTPHSIVQPSLFIKPQKANQLQVLGLLLQSLQSVNSVWFLKFTANFMLSLSLWQIIWYQTLDCQMVTTLISSFKSMHVNSLVNQ